MREKKIFWIDNDRKYMRQGDWKRPVTDPSFFIDEKLKTLYIVFTQFAFELVLVLKTLRCGTYAIDLF